MEFNFTLPTSDRSYLSFFKIKIRNISSATSIEGASPGLKTLYMSFKASDLLEFLSTLKFLEYKGLYLLDQYLLMLKNFPLDLLFFEVVLQ